MKEICTNESVINKENLEKLLGGGGGGESYTILCQIY